MSGVIRGAAHEVLGRAYRERASGRLATGTESTRLYFHRGDLFVHPRHEKGREIEQRLGENPGSLREVVEALGREVGGRELVLEDETVRPETLLGPLPTAWFVMEGAAVGSDEKELMARLGGPAHRWGNGGASRAIEELPGLDPDLTMVLPRLAGTISAGELVRGEEKRRLELLRALLRLGAVGLAEPLADSGQEILTPRALQLFRARIADDLSANPTEREPALHRQEVANLFGRLGNLDHYQLLGVESSCDEQELLAAFHRQARLVHPSHASRLGIPDRNRLLEVLFERVTEAYLVLNDPKRRAAYNTLVGIGVRSEVGGAQREEEKRRLARLSYSHAASCIAGMDYSQAAQLLLEATRLDPKPEYWARLGMVQAKNPNWMDSASSSYRKAVEGDPDHAGYRVGWAEVLEKLGRADLAREQYERALELMPSHPKARSAMERLGKGGSKAGRGLRGLLGRAD